MKNAMSEKRGMPPVNDLISSAKSSGVRLVACRTTIKDMGIMQSDLIEGTEIGNLAAFLEYGMESTITLFI